MENQNGVSKYAKGYEGKMVVILFCVFGFVMLDRQALNFLSVFVLDDLGINTAQFGFILSGFAFTWAISGYLGGWLSDKFYNKKRLFLGVMILLFSVFSFSTGLAKGYVSLFAIRLIMGIFEGPTLPLAQSILIAQSSPKRRGMNMGLIQGTAPSLFAVVFGPIVLVALAQAFNWRMTFFLTIIPGLILVLFIFKTLKEPYPDKKKPEVEAAERVSPLVVFKNRNALISFIMSPFYIGWYMLLVCFAPLFLVTVKGLTPTTMSLVIAAMGAGGVVWGVVVPALSDKFGRKPIFLIFSIFSVVTPIGLLYVPGSSVWLIAILVFVGFSGVGCHPMYMSTIPSESVGLKAAGTAIGTIMAFGELGGGVVGTAIAGILGQTYGLQSILVLDLGMAIVCFVLGIFYYETAPAILAKRAGNQEAVA